MTTIPFAKMVGTGNDFVVVDARRPGVASLKRAWPAVSRAVCDRRAGIGADGLLVLEPSHAADIRMRVFNPDGSEAEMCGNGARCVALYVRNGARGTGHGARGRPVTIETKAGVLSATVRGTRVAMRMTDPTGLTLDYPSAAGSGRRRVGFINTGVPHAVVPVARLNAIDVEHLGRALRHHRAFSPGGANVDFIQPDPRRNNYLRVRTYERGVEAETPACGTGVAASAVVQTLWRHGHAAGNGKLRRHTVNVETRSGDVLAVSFSAQGCGRDLRVTDLVLEGEAALVFRGDITWPLSIAACGRAEVLTCHARTSAHPHVRT